MKKTYKISLECLMGLLQGKEIHFMTHNFDGTGEEIVLLPPQGNLVMTREEAERLRREAYDAGFMKFLEVLSKVEGVVKAEVREVID